MQSDESVVVLGKHFAILIAQDKIGIEGVGPQIDVVGLCLGDFQPDRLAHGWRSCIPRT